MGFLSSIAFSEAHGRDWHVAHDEQTWRGDARSLTFAIDPVAVDRRRSLRANPIPDRGKRVSSEEQIFDESGDRQSDQQEDDDPDDAHAPRHALAHHSVHHSQTLLYG
jgi:hypothetical protein